MIDQQKIHPTAIVSSEASLAEGVTIGPYCVIGANVRIGEGTILKSHVVIEGIVQIGQRNIFHQFSSIGAPPQDISYKDEQTKVIIGDDNNFREFVSIHRGTKKEKGVTQIGNNCYLMAYSHLGHDVLVGNNVIIVNAVNLAGHVTVGDDCTIGGGTNIGQFITLGRGAYIGGASAIHKDIPPFCTAYGNRVNLKGINIIGMRRKGHPRHIITEMVDFYKAMESSSLSPRAFVEKNDNMEEFKDNEIVQETANFIKNSEIGMAQFS